MTAVSAKVPRRDFLTLSAASMSAGGLLANSAPVQADPPSPTAPWIDVNVYVSRWPFRRLRYDTPGELTSLLRRHGITQAWTGSFDGVFHKDIGAVNRRLVETCGKQGDGLLAPFGSINPLLPEWQDELRLCAEQYKMPGIRLHPGYHGYDLKTPAFAELLKQAAERNLIVQLCGWLEDPRTQPALMRVPTVDLTPLTELAAANPDAKIVLINGVNLVGGKAQAELLSLPNVSSDIAQLETSEGITKLMKVMPAERILFGSYSPMFYFEAARLKLLESVLTAEQETAIRSASAQTLLPA
ncbi:amidohydrolase [Blastopirellula sp. JC732]|uniref:Amidohydrolase n=1 Tax=Blastopirellula sediminis TaxID=2894196 RepID=A0A9X1MLS9_9BACT|nr:amidohydrolase family protein [Blastopirellula sediminis]MCC9607304.1 amidohydrolase [Blastopirellula sediminis]MCC9629403.1 amidohydrolase [Blastopirellula sediminis]